MHGRPCPIFRAEAAPQLNFSAEAQKRPIFMAMEQTLTSERNPLKGHYTSGRQGGGHPARRRHEGTTRRVKLASELARDSANRGGAEEAMAMDHALISGIFGAGRTPKGRGPPHTEASSNRGHRRSLRTPDQIHSSTQKTRGPVHRPLSAGMTRTHKKSYGHNFKLF